MDDQLYNFKFVSRTSALETQFNFSRSIYPGWYRRTYALGMVAGWFFSAVFGLFDYDTESWVYEPGKGFKFFELTKRKVID